MTTSPSLSASLPPSVARERDAILSDWKAGDKTRRLWARDASLWTGADEGRWLGWLTIAKTERADVARLRDFAADVRRDGVRDVLLLGMGGSSLGPEVFGRTFVPAEGFPSLLVLDSTDPAQVSWCERRVDVERTLFVVSSKSGGTLEPTLFEAYFFARAAALVGEAEAARRFVAITDPGSALEKTARARGFRRVFHGDPSIGGRFSVLSDFGLVPAALLGLPVERMLDAVLEMGTACGLEGEPERNPGVALGAVLGAAARSGRDKLTVVAGRSLAAMGAWLEQLIAESTGKQGKGIIPVDGEPLGDPTVYGDDRVFCHLRVRGEGGDGDGDGQEDARRLDALAAAGHPVVRIELPSLEHLAAEFFRWEFATAVAGSVLRLHPFDQPDVEASKVETKRLTSAYESAGALPAETPVAEDRGVRLFADEREAARILAGAKGSRSLAALLRAHLASVRPGDYVALLAYVAMSPDHAALLSGARMRLRDRLRVATCLGFGPRFLHSTGQAYKGGPNTGVFLQITCDDARDVAVPGRRLSFGVVKAAQARGDLAVLQERGRRALRVHLGADVAGGLATLAAAITEATA